MKGIVVTGLVSVLFILSTVPTFADTVVTGNSSASVNSSTSVTTNGGVTHSSQTIDTDVNGQTVHLQSNQPGSNSVDVHQEDGQKPVVKINSTDPDAVITQSDQEASATPTQKPTDNDQVQEQSLDSAQAPVLEDPQTGQVLAVDTFADRLGAWISQLSNTILAQTKQMLAQIGTKMP